MISQRLQFTHLKEDGSAVDGGSAPYLDYRPATMEEKAVLEKLSPEHLQITELAGERVEKILTAAPGNGSRIGGIKVIAPSGWFAARPSGTEDIYKIYTESFRGRDHLQRIQEEAQEIVRDAIAGYAKTAA